MATIQLLSGEKWNVMYSTLDELRVAMMEYLGVSHSRIRLLHPDGWDILDPPLLLSLFDPMAMETSVMYAMILDPPMGKIVFTYMETAYEDTNPEVLICSVYSLRITCEENEFVMYFYVDREGRIIPESSVEVYIPSMFERAMCRSNGMVAPIHCFRIDANATIYYNPSEFLRADWFAHGEEIISLVRRFWRGEIEKPYLPSDIFRVIDTEEYDPEIAHMVESVSLVDHRFHHNDGKYI